MSGALLKVAVVGHTNVGKTSLLRTLTRDVDFGDVSSRPATTRHVEGVALLIEGEPVAELYDTPGLEDSSGLLERLDANTTGRRDGLETINAFLESDDAKGGFSQEAKALRQVLSCDVSLYVIDARDRVLGKHRDELEILGRSARPVVPVLNFVASDDARTAEWREHLARVNMHAVAEFDSVVLDEQGEFRLFEKMRTLLDAFGSTLDALIDDRRRQRRRLIDSSADLVAGLLVDVAAHVVTATTDQTSETRRSMDELRARVREREQATVAALLELHRFRSDDYDAGDLPLAEGQFGLDLFSPEALKAFGVRATGAAAAGAMAGLAVDAMFGGLTFGAAAGGGALLGALFGTAQSHGRRLLDRMRGHTELRVADATIMLLALRQMDLVQALLRRGHASQHRMTPNADGEKPARGWVLPESLRKAALHPDWSSLAPEARERLTDDGRRASTVQALADRLAPVLRGDEPRETFFR